jgi:hypothetical protein
MTWNQAEYSKKRRDCCKQLGMCTKCYKRPALVQRKQCAECQMDSVIQEAFKFDRRRKMPGSTAKRGSCYVDQFCIAVRKQWRDDIKNKWTGKCFYTGLQIEIGATAGLDHMLPVSRASAFGPAKVFHPDNLVWCHSSVNILKGDMTADEFYVWLRHDLPMAIASMSSERATHPTGDPPSDQQR